MDDTEFSRHSSSLITSLARGLVSSFVWLIALLAVPVMAAILLFAAIPGEHQQVFRSAASQVDNWTQETGARCMLLRGTVRSVPGTDFTDASTTGQMVPFEMWTSIADYPLWVARKPGCLCIGTNSGVATAIRQLNSKPVVVHNSEYGIASLGWIGPFSKVDELMQLEQVISGARSATVERNTLKGTDGLEKIFVRVTDSTPPRYPTIPESTFFRAQAIREYVIDAATHKLESAKVYSIKGGSQVLLFEVNSILYDTDLGMPTETEKQLAGIPTMRRTQFLDDANS